MSQGSASWPLVVSVALIAGGAGYLLAPREQRSVQSAMEGQEGMGSGANTPQVSGALGQLDEISAERDALKKQIGELVTRLEKASSQNREYEETIRMLKAAVQSPKADSVSPTEAQPLKALAPAPIPSSQWQAALDKVDWEVTGQALKEMLPLVAEYAACIREGKSVPDSSVGIARWSNVLVDTALKLRDAGLPGSGVNGPYTHYAAVVNQVATYLERMNLPLSPEQGKAFGDIAGDFSTRDERRVDSHGAEVPLLGRILAESRLKAGFYAALRQELDPPQRQALAPEDLRDRVGVDLFSPALLWATGMKPLKVTGREDFARVLKSELVRELELGPEESGRVGAILEDWVTGLEASHLDPGDALEHMGMVKLSRIHDAASDQLALFEKLMPAGILTPRQQDLLRGVSHVWVALRP
ncbi:MAG: hypothetical protein AB7F75_02755 [Planctomycetota bacterium]